MKVSVRPEQRQARLLSALIATSALLLGVLGALISHAFQSAPECSENSECGRGQCLDGICVMARISPPTATPRCVVGFPCNGEGCERHGEELSCVDGRYRKILGPELCQRESVRSYLADIASRCGNADQCTPTALKDLVISNEEFDRLIQDFGTAFALHFDTGRPRSRDRSGTSPRWNEARNTYIDQLIPLVPTLEGADILLIATASKTTKGSDKNEILAHRRLREVRHLLLEATKRAGGNPDTLRIKDTNLGDLWQRDEDGYKHLSLSRSIFWEPSRERAFTALIDDFDAATKGLNNRAKENQRAWSEQVMNQAVFVIPNPCTVEGAADDDT